MMKHQFIKFTIFMTSVMFCTEFLIIWCVFLQNRANIKKDTFKTFLLFLTSPLSINCLKSLIFIPASIKMTPWKNLKIAFYKFRSNSQTPLLFYPRRGAERLVFDLRRPVTTNCRFTWIFPVMHRVQVTIRFQRDVGNRMQLIQCQ